MWNDSRINYECKKIFIKEGYKVEDIEMFEVLYEDCYETPWVMCRHKDAWYQAELMKFYISLIPVNVRQFNRHFIALPADDRGGPDTYNDYDSILFKGQANFHSIVANSAKSMGKYTGEGRPVWDTAWWRDAVDTNATALMNPTSLISMEECFGQTTVLAIMFFQGHGIGQDRTPEVRKIEPLLWKYRVRYGLLFLVSWSRFCVERLLEDSPVGLPDQLPDIEA
ncbi:hypothetical protein G6011_03355 [Alternaria panax]|uniref:Uncharacterized protein n=1 Tax=Alternaria panax TaxID=48097 RepID=A0AAD4IEW7_9PLEO|nr:hypothetical protein G6011_03355 [Alternaria panax]